MQREPEPCGIEWSEPVEGPDVVSKTKMHSHPLYRDDEGIVMAEVSTHSHPSYRKNKGGKAAGLHGQWMTPVGAM